MKDKWKAWLLTAALILILVLQYLLASSVR
jgi:hypothetical protein